jgi:hypothetical protein
MNFFFEGFIFKKVPTFCTCADSSFNFLFLREKKLSILAFFFEVTNFENASSNPILKDLENHQRIHRKCRLKCEDLYKKYSFLNTVPLISISSRGEHLESLASCSASKLLIESQSHFCDLYVFCFC